MRYNEKIFYCFTVSIDNDDVYECMIKDLQIMPGIIRFDLTADSYGPVSLLMGRYLDTIWMIDIENHLSIVFEHRISTDDIVQELLDVGSFDYDEDFCLILAEAIDLIRRNYNTGVLNFPVPDDRHSPFEDCLPF